MTNFQGLLLKVSSIVCEAQQLDHAKSAHNQYPTVLGEESSLCRSNQSMKTVLPGTKKTYIVLQSISNIDKDIYITFTCTKFAYKS